jgi:hypothetical protein
VRRPSAATAAVLATVLLLAGCDDTGGRASGEPGSATADTPSESTSTPDVEPASGKLVETSYFTVHVPDGFKVNVTAEDFSIYASNTGGETEISFGIVPTYGNDFTLDQLARQALRTGVWARRPRMTDHTTLAGEPAYHLVGPVGSGKRTDTYGVAYQDQHVDVTIDSFLPPDKLDDLAESVLATWQWK